MARAFFSSCSSISLGEKKTFFLSFHSMLEQLRSFFMGKTFFFLAIELPKEKKFLFKKNKRKKRNNEYLWSGIEINLVLFISLPGTKMEKYTTKKNYSEKPGTKQNICSETKKKKIVLHSDGARDLGPC